MKILLADDHGLFRDSMAVWLNQLDANLEITFSASFNEVKHRLINQSFDLIMLDLGMPGMQGVISIEYFRELCAKTPVIIVSADENPLTITACINAGANGYVTKSSSGEIILQAIKQVLNGVKYIPATAASQSALKLSDKQKLILAFIIDGHSNKAISEKLHFSEGTVKQYISRILRELNVDNRTQAANIGRELLGIGGS